MTLCDHWLKWMRVNRSQTHMVPHPDTMLGGMPAEYPLRCNEPVRLMVGGISISDRWRSCRESYGLCHTNLLCVLMSRSSITQLPCRDRRNVLVSTDRMRSCSLIQRIMSVSYILSKAKRGIAVSRNVSHHLQIGLDRNIVFKVYRSHLLIYSTHFLPY